MGPAAGALCEPTAGGSARVVSVVAASCREVVVVVVVVVGRLARPSDSPVTTVCVVLGPAAAGALSCVLLPCWPKLPSAG